MGIHSKWDSDGNLVFFDTASTNLLKIGSGGITAPKIYVGTTGYSVGTTAGVSYSSTGTVISQITVVNGIITAISTA